MPFTEGSDARQTGVLSQLAADDRGSISLLMVSVAASLFLMVGLVVDGSGKARATAAVDDVAASAAAAAGQAIDLEAYRSGGNLTADRTQAAAAARRFLASAGVEGTVSAIDGGRAIEVTTTANYTSKLLGWNVAVHGHATAELLIVANGEAM